MKELKITSPSFEEGGWMPQKHSAYGENISPELRIDGIDESGKTMAITLDDLGHPIQPGYNHWVAWNLPVTHVIPEGIPAGGTVEEPIHLLQGLAYGKHCYKGPKPPFNWNHDYLFTVYILDCEIDLGADSDKNQLLSKIEGHVIQKGEIITIYQRRHK